MSKCQNKGPQTQNKLSGCLTTQLKPNLSKPFLRFLRRVRRYERNEAWQSVWAMEADEETVDEWADVIMRERRVLPASSWQKRNSSLPTVQQTKSVKQTNSKCASYKFPLIVSWTWSKTKPASFHIDRNPFYLHFKLYLLKTLITRVSSFVGNP